MTDLTDKNKNMNVKKLLRETDEPKTYKGYERVIDCNGQCYTAKIINLNHMKMDVVRDHIKNSYDGDAFVTYFIPRSMYHRDGTKHQTYMEWSVLDRALIKKIEDYILPLI